MLLAILKTMRPKQWTKNIFLFAALIFDRKLGYLDLFLETLAGFFIFSILSSTVYIINDIADVNADRNHPKKKNRPIASGKLPIKVAVSVAIFLIVISLTLAYLLSPSFFVINLVYFVVFLGYSFYLKHIPLIDVMIIAAGFVLRVVAGVSLIEVERFSPWLYVVTTLLALYIGFGKRRAELVLLHDGANSHRRVLDGYSIQFLDQLITIVSSTTIIAYSLYSFSAANLPENHAMMLTIPIVIYGIFRYLFLIQIKGEGGAPDELLLSDLPLMFTCAIYGFSVLFIFYLF